MQDHRKESGINKGTQPAMDKENSIPSGGLQVNQVMDIEADHTSRPREKNSVRKRKRDESTWKVVKWKKMRALGLQYTSTSGKIVLEKAIKLCHCKCRNKCKQFSNVEREDIMKGFYGLESYERQRDYIVQHITEVPCQRVSKEVKRGNRENSYQYHLSLAGVKIKVCQKFFIATLAISRKMIRVALEKRDSFNPQCVTSDKRGKQKASNVISAYVKRKIQEYIESFPAVEAHYVRKSSKRKYLASNLNVAKMHDMYMENNKNDLKAHAKQSTYRYIFNREYNLSFHIPKKDQCLCCNKLRNSKEKEDQILYEKHLKDARRAQDEKKHDKEISQSDDTYKCFTFDLQKVLYTPCSNVSSMYYTRKLSYYNLTTLDLKTKDGSCFTWDETNGMRGSSEIGTCINTLLTSMPKNVKSVCLFSDSCGGQNRNQNMLGALLFTLQSTHIECIDMKFLVSGHTSMEVDSMHSMIERAKKNCTINIPEDWNNIITSARRGEPYRIIPLEYKDMLDFKSMMMSFNCKTNTNGLAVKWNSVRWIRVLKMKPYTMLYKYNFDDNEFYSVDIRKKKKSTRQSMEEAEADSLQVGPKYDQCLPISKEKKKDLLRLCETGAISEVYRSFYDKLPCDGAKKTRLAEPDLCDSDIEEDD